MRFWSLVVGCVKHSQMYLLIYYVSIQSPVVFIYLFSHSCLGQGEPNGKVWHNRGLASRLLLLCGHSGIWPVRPAGNHILAFGQQRSQLERIQLCPGSHLARVCVHCIWMCVDCEYKGPVCRVYWRCAMTGQNPGTVFTVNIGNHNWRNMSVDFSHPCSSCSFAQQLPDRLFIMQLSVAACVCGCVCVWSDIISFCASASFSRVQLEVFLMNETDLTGSLH